MTHRSAPLAWRPRLTLAVFGFFLAVFSLTNSGVDSSEGGYNYTVAKQLVTHGSLSFAESRPGIYTTAPNGRTYASHEFGNALFMIPVAAVDAFLDRVRPTADQRRSDFLRSFLPSIYWAAALSAIFLLLTNLFQLGAVAALQQCALLAFSTFLWAYTRSQFDGVLCALLLCAAVYFLFRFGRDHLNRDLVLASVFLGLGFITRLSMLFPIIAGFVYLLLVETTWARRRKAVLVAGTVLMPFLAWQLYYNHLRTGDAFISPVQTAQYAFNNGLHGNVLKGIAGLLLSPGKSVFVYAPILLLAVICWPHFHRRHPRESIFLLVMAVPWFLLHAKMVNWYGAWGWGPRHFVTILPLLAIPYLAEHTYIWRSPKLRWFALAALSFGGILALASVVGNPHYRQSVATQEGRGEDAQFVWSAGENQAVDMIRGLYENGASAVSDARFAYCEACSPANIYASTTVNMWPNSALYAGVAPAAVFCVVFFLLLMAAASLRIIYSRQDAAAPSRDAS